MVLSAAVVVIECTTHCLFHLYEPLNMTAAVGLGGAGLQEVLVGDVHVLAPDEVVETE